MSRLKSLAVWSLGVGRRGLATAGGWLVARVALAILAGIAWRSRRQPREVLVWGVTPVPNNIYWSRAMRASGYKSETLVTHHYSINKREDFDHYLIDHVPPWLRRLFGERSADSILAPYFAMAYVIRTARVLHTSYAGGPLGVTSLWKWEPRLLRRAGVKTVVIPVGSDAFKYSAIMDMSLRHVLLSNYAYLAREEPRITAAVDLWTKYADTIIVDWMMDGIGRWDVTVPSVLAIDTDHWRPKQDYSRADGRNGPVRIIHTPNHRFFKGTEFLIEAVKELKDEGLQIDLVLLEGVPNARVREEMQSADILAEQFVAIGYGLSAIEGFASGLVVLSNLSEEPYTRLFRRYAFLNECPTVSTRIEDIKGNLRLLVGAPELRETLGRASRRYAEKYHSYGAAQRLFSAIYERIVEGKTVDLQNLFHPLSGKLGTIGPRIETPLIENRIVVPHHDGDRARRIEH